MKKSSDFLFLRHFLNCETIKCSLKLWFFYDSIKKRYRITNDSDRWEKELRNEFSRPNRGAKREFSNQTGIRIMRTELEKWFSDRPVWLQEAAVRLIRNKTIYDKDYKDLYEQCLNEAKGQPDKLSDVISMDRLLNNREFGNKIKMKSIGNIKGINNLSPKKPLDFGEGNLIIIYGSNRSGKSGYVRILKNVCGAKSRSPLLPNIFKGNQPEQSCNIGYLKDDSLKKIEWNPDVGIINDLSCVNIFDSECGKAYVTDENETAYEPEILLFFSRLVKICEKISSEMTNKIQRHPSKLPVCPTEYNTTEEAKWYKSLSANTTEQNLKNYCLWTSKDQEDMAKFQERLSQQDPAKKAKDIRKQNQYIKELISELDNFRDSFSDRKCEEINNLKEKYAVAKRTVETAAKQIFKKSIFSGVGGDVWKQLWKYAREYSEKEAYKGQSFPIMANDAHCVLCQQKLDDEAQSRFLSFEEFVKGKAQKELSNIKESLDSSINSLPQIPDEGSFKTKMDAAGLQSEEKELNNLYVELNKRKEKLVILNNQLSLSPLPSIENWKAKIKTKIEKNEQEAEQYDAVAKESNREKLISKKKNLQIKQWLSQNKNSIEKEINRLKHIKLLESAKELTDTTALSRKKSNLSEKLITQDFIKRFNAELKKLKADEIKVELVKSRVTKGKSLHQIRLKGLKENSAKTETVLSEGENRIVALSAFFADATGKNNPAPFVFDDPVSSLDQDFEEAVANRLVELSNERQVIIFTHRLSLLGLIEENCDKKNIRPNIVYIETELWGSGEPGNTPLFAKNPKSALHSLIEKLSSVQKNLEEQGHNSYNEKVKTLCSDFRIVIEKTIESVLLSGIIKRHRKEIRTKQILKLFKINQDDCKLLDNLMTKYSTFVHSLSDETSHKMPCPEELERDFKKLKSWMEDYKNRLTT